MKLCESCGTWDMKPGSGCRECGKPFSQFTKVKPPKDHGDGRTPPKTPRQERDDR